jgi:hypothetical protein
VNLSVRSPIVQISSEKENIHNTLDQKYSKALQYQKYSSQEIRKKYKNGKSKILFKNKAYKPYFIELRREL